MICGIVLAASGGAAEAATPRVTELRAEPALTLPDGKQAAVEALAVAHRPRRVVAAAGDGVVVLRPLADGRGLRVTQRVGGGFGRALLVVDLDGDGREDAVTAGHGYRKSGRTAYPSVTVRHGERGGRFGAPVVHLLRGGRDDQNPTIGSLASGDVNGDGRADLVAAVPLTGKPGSGVITLLGRPGRRLAQVADSTLVPYVSAVALGDLTGDGRLDLVADGRLFAGTGTGRFRRPARRDDNPGDGPATVTDFDGDGRPDVVGVYGEQLAVRPGTGRGIGRWNVLGPAGCDCRGVLVRDLDGDRRPDAIGVDRGSIVIARGGGRSVDQLVTRAATLRGLALLDVDADGRTDVVAGDDAGRIRVLRNVGLRNLARPHLVGEPVSIAADRTALVRLSCSAGVGSCFGGVTLFAAGRRVVGRTSYLLSAGRTSRVIVAVRRPPTSGQVTVRVTSWTAGPELTRTRLRPATAAERRASCLVDQRFIVARDAATVILGGSFIDQVAFACDLASGKHTYLRIEYPDGPFAVNGRYAVGAGRDFCEVDCFDVIAIWDLARNGRRRVIARAPRECERPCWGDVGSIVAGPRGEVAWTVCGSVDGFRCNAHVLVADARGSKQVAAGPGVGFRSLRLSAGGFTYVRDGVRVEHPFRAR